MFDIRARRERKEVESGGGGKKELEEEVNISIEYLIDTR